MQSMFTYKLVDASCSSYLLTPRSYSAYVEPLPNLGTGEQDKSLFNVAVHFIRKHTLD